MKRIEIILYDPVNTLSKNLCFILRKLWSPKLYYSTRQGAQDSPSKCQKICVHVSVVCVCIFLYHPFIFCVFHNSIIVHVCNSYVKCIL